MIVVTGASGLIGRAVAARAMQQGTAVRLQGRSAEKVAQALYTLNVHEALEVVEVDLRSAEQGHYDRLMNGATSIIHCAGLVHQVQAPAAEYEALNFQATKMIAAAAKKAKVDHFVFLSTSAVYGVGPFVDIPEDAPTRGESAYSISKLRCEQWLKENQPSPITIVLRPSLVFGEGDRGNMLSLIKQIDKGLYFHIGGNEAKKSVIYGADIAQAAERCISACDAGYHIFNVANPKTISVEELSNAIAIRLGKMPPPTVPQPLVRAGAMLGGAILGNHSPLTVQKMDKLMTTTTLSVRKLVSETGFVPSVPLDEALKLEIEWARKEEILARTHLTR